MSKQSESLNTRYGWTYALRTGAYADLEMYREALADYDKAVELGPFRPSTYQRRGEIHRRLKTPDNAAADFSKAIELRQLNSPDFPTPS